MNTQEKSNTDTDHCPDCGTVYQWMDVPCMGKRVRINCTCEEREERAFEQGLLEGERRRLLDAAHIPDKFRAAWCSLKHLRQDVGNRLAIAAAQEFATSFPGTKNLVLTGRVGVGKTTLAIATMKAAIWRRIVPGYFGTTIEILSEIRKGFTTDEVAEIDLVNRFIMMPILVIDDLGKEKLTEWGQEKIFQIVDGRWSRSRPMIVTLKLREEDNPDDAPGVLRAKYPEHGEDIVSRLMENSRWIAMTGEDRRRT